MWYQIVTRRCWYRRNENKLEEKLWLLAKIVFLEATSTRAAFSYEWKIEEDVTRLPRDDEAKSEKVSWEINVKLFPCDILSLFRCLKWKQRVRGKEKCYQNDTQDDVGTNVGFNKLFDALILKAGYQLAKNLLSLERRREGEV